MVVMVGKGNRPAAVFTTQDIDKLKPNTSMPLMYTLTQCTGLLPSVLLSSPSVSVHWYMLYQVTLTVLGTIMRKP